MAETPTLRDSISEAQAIARKSGKPLAVILAGHNGAGKSTLWKDHVADLLRCPLVNADRMMLSILPETDENGHLREWARLLRDSDEKWMKIAQEGVEGFVSQTMNHRAPFAVETVFSHWERQPDGTHASKIDLIAGLQRAGYFVLLLFAALSSAEMSAARVATRANKGGHTVDPKKLMNRFGRTQQAIRYALSVADASVLVDNSRDAARAFTPCYISVSDTVSFDIRRRGKPPAEIGAWMKVIVPDACSRPAPCRPRPASETSDRL